MNEVTFGNSDDFQEKLKEVDKKLSNLIVEFYVGVDGGDKSLIELINSVFEDVKNLENLTDDIGTETETAAKNADAIDKNVDSTKETIRELQAELSRLMNSTSEDAPQALQDAFDRSEKFNTNSSQLKEILDQVKRILKDYEINLLNSKLLTSQAIEKFAEVAKKQESTAKEQAVVDEQLSGVDNMKASENLMKNMKKLAGEALEQSNKVFEEAFDLLNEVSEFELHDKLKEINDKVEELNKHSEATGVNVKQFADDNAKFLDKVEATIDAAEIAEVKALKLQKEIEELLIMVNGIHVDAIKAIADKDTIIENAKNIYNNLQDFTLKVEKSRENARMALEKIPEILKKINDSVDIVEKLEDKLDASTKAAIKAQEMCTTAKQQMDEILGESDEIRARIEKLGKDFESLPSNNEDADKEGTRISDEIDKLEKIEAVDSPLIEAAKIKIDKTKTQSQSTDVAIDVALKNIEELMDQLGKLKNIDHDVLNDFGEGRL